MKPDVVTFGGVDDEQLHLPPSFPDSNSVGWIFWAGMGGAASIADHMAAELLTGMGAVATGHRSISLTSNAAVLTALANDGSFDDVIASQLEVLSQMGDVAVLISTSGESASLVAAARLAQSVGVTSVGITTTKQSSLWSACDLVLAVKPGPTPEVQERLVAVGHWFCRRILGTP